MGGKQTAPVRPRAESLSPRRFIFSSIFQTSMMLRPAHFSGLVSRSDPVSSVIFPMGFENGGSHPVGHDSFSALGSNDPFIGVVYPIC